MGKAVGKPVFKLLGGRTKEKISCYCVEALRNATWTRCRPRRRGYLDQGFTAMKMRFGYGPKDGPRAWRRTSRPVRRCAK